MFSKFNCNTSTMAPAVAAVQRRHISYVAYPAQCQLSANFGHLALGENEVQLFPFWKEFTARHMRNADRGRS